MDPSMIEHEIRKVKRRRIEINHLKTGLDLEDWNLGERQDALERLIRGGSGIRNSSLTTAGTQLHQPASNLIHEPGNVGNVTLSQRDAAVHSIERRENAKQHPNDGPPNAQEMAQQLQRKPDISRYIVDQAHSKINRSIEQNAFGQQLASMSQGNDGNCTVQDNLGDDDDDDLIITGSKRKFSESQEPAEIKEEEEVSPKISNPFHQSKPVWKAGFEQSLSTSPLRSSVELGTSRPKSCSKHDVADQEEQQSSQFLTSNIRSYLHGPNPHQQSLVEGSSEANQAALQSRSTIAQELRQALIHSATRKQTSPLFVQQVQDSPYSRGASASPSRAATTRPHRISSDTQSTQRSHTLDSTASGNEQQRQRELSQQHYPKQASGVFTTGFESVSVKDNDPFVDLTSSSPPPPQASTMAQTRDQQLSLVHRPSCSCRGLDPSCRLCQIRRIGSSRSQNPALTSHQLTARTSPRLSLLNFNSLLPSQSQIHQQNLNLQSSNPAISEKSHLELRFCRRLLTALYGTKQGSILSAPFISNWQPSIQTLVLTRWRAGMKRTLFMPHTTTTHSFLLMCKRLLPPRGVEGSLTTIQEERGIAWTPVQDLNDFAEVVHGLIRELTNMHPRNCCMLPAKQLLTNTAGLNDTADGSPFSEQGHNGTRKRIHQQYLNVC